MHLATDNQTAPQQPPPAQCNGQRQLRQRWLLEACAAVFLAVIVIIICDRGFDPRLTDFRMFYSAAEMVRHGAADRLYDLAEQHAFQLRSVNKVGLIFDYPAATILLYLPGAWFSIQTAYLLWTTASVLLLLLSAVFLNLALRLFKHPTVLFAVALLFVPIWLNLMQGQVVVVLLLAYSLALFFLSRGREVTAGCALALALVKFHLVLPFILVLLVRRRWQILAGFSALGVAFLGLCFAVAGWSFLAQYSNMLLRLPSLPDTGMHLNAMANLHGLYVGFLRHEPPLILLAAVYLALLVWSARAWKDDDTGFAIALVVTVLISHHLNPHDLSLLIIPLAVLFKRAPLLSWRALPLALFAPPLPLYLLISRYWLLSCAAIALLVALSAPEKNLEAA